MIKAIETEYNGYKFRSRTEARWAVFLDSLGEKYEYEKEGYELPSGRYLPDFFLPRLDCWLEIKGIDPTTEETELCYELAMGTGKPVVMAWGLPFASKKYYHDREKCIPNHIAEHILNCPHRAEFARQGKATFVCEDYTAERLKVYCLDSTDSSMGEGWWENCFWAIDKTDKLCICSNNGRSDRLFSKPHGTDWNEDFTGMVQRWGIKKPIDESHVTLAKSARFEFGEQKKKKTKKSDSPLALFDEKIKEYMDGGWRNGKF